jgi:hypothetical protein
MALRDLIPKLYAKHGKKVVILVDEYDDPVSSHTDNMQLAKENSDVLRTFYAALKDCDDYIRFVFVTGVTRYGLMGLSAGLNHLKDISFNPRFAAICGFTPTEMDQYLADRYAPALETLKSTGYMPSSSTEQDLRQEILNWYDGYSWDGKTRVLNPISVLNFFENQKFSPYWLETSPSRNFLTNIIQNNPYDFTKDKFENIPMSDFTWATVGDVKAVPFLFHTGYLTIDKINIIDKLEHCNVKISNFEINKGYYKILIKSLFNDITKYVDIDSEKLNFTLKSKDEKKLSNIIGALYSGIPAEHHVFDESFYHTVLWAYCSGLVSEARSEEPGALGDLDLILVLKDDTHVVIELKYESDKGQSDIKSILNKQAKNALASIKKKQYGERYRLQGKKFVAVGLGVFGPGQVQALFE